MNESNSKKIKIKNKTKVKTQQINKDIYSNQTLQEIVCFGLLKSK